MDPILNKLGSGLVGDIATGVESGMVLIRLSCHAPLNRGCRASAIILLHIIEIKEFLQSDRRYHYLSKQSILPRRRAATFLGASSTSRRISSRTAL